jgi:uridine kinase
MINFINMVVEKKLQKGKVIVAIDGRCGSGKTTLANRLADRFGGRVVRMDHFFLPPEKRTDQRLATPGGNVDYERFLLEVAPNIHEAYPQYKAYNCHTNDYYDVKLLNQPLTIVEGTYSLHPSLQHLYDLKIFMDVPSDIQAQRIKDRDGDYAQVFFDKWIPLEELYFKELDIQQNSHITYNTGE